ncbi:MAG: transposase, partial [Spirochaetes bacterium]|nr:transposase [Candidatus Ornithospirochaeta stercoravium]
MAYVPKYEEESKKNLVALHSNGKSQAELCREYGVSESALAKWIKNYSS